MARGREFQIVGAASGNREAARTETCAVTGNERTNNNLESDERKVRDGV